MSASLRKSFLSVIIVLLISSCAEAERPSTSDIVGYLQTTNLDSRQFPWTRGLADGIIKRWDIERDGLIPVKFNGSDLAKEATDEIEAVLQMSIFDRASIADVPDNMDPDAHSLLRINHICNSDRSLCFHGRACFRRLSLRKTHG